MIPSGFRPIGYSWFIRFFHFFSKNYEALFTGQFLINAVATLSFLFSTKYFFKLKGTIFYVLSGLLIFSPTVIYNTNYVMSDTIFNSLTLLFLATSFWIIIKPNFLNISLHLTILYLVINVRYAALFYPILSIGLFLMHINKNKWYIVLAVLPVLIGIKIYKDTKAETKKVYQYNEFSAFSGWAAANNAVSIIPHIDLPLKEFRNKDSRFIHRIITSYPDSTYHFKNIKATHFMWRKDFPGKHVFVYNAKTKNLRYTNAWIYTGRQFKDYASFLIKKYPFKYFRYYLWPNFMNMFQSYDIPNIKQYTPDKLSTEYFELDFKNHVYKNSFLHKTNPIRKIYTPLLWIICIASGIFLVIKRNSMEINKQKLLGFSLLFLILYLGFSVLAHPINNFRYLMPIYCIQVLIPLVAILRFAKK